MSEVETQVETVETVEPQAAAPEAEVLGNDTTSAPEQSDSSGSTETVGESDTQTQSVTEEGTASTDSDAVESSEGVTEEN
jgi:hypothetical protein